MGGLFEKDAWGFYESLGSPKYILGPMVDHSELGWRILCRRYGAQLCYTPMINSKLFKSSAAYRRRNWDYVSDVDWPLIAQFCGDDPETLLESARLVENECNGVDVNLGCPQKIAKRGHYGAFLQDEWKLVSEIVKTLSQNLSVPTTCKIRIFSDPLKTIRYAQLLEEAGCSILAVHGRTREQKGHLMGLADWEQIKMVREALRIPVFANGNILAKKDIDECLSFTKTCGVMVAESCLYNPAIFSDQNVPACDLGLQYIDICRKYMDKTKIPIVRSHLTKLFRKTFEEFPFIRPLITEAKSINDCETAVIEIKKLSDLDLDKSKFIARPYLRAQKVEPVLQAKCVEDISSIF